MKNQRVCSFQRTFLPFLILQIGCNVCVPSLHAQTSSGLQSSCNPTFTGPRADSMLSGTTSVALSTAGCSGGFARLYLGSATFDGDGNFSIDTNSIPNGSYLLGAIYWDSTGLIKEGSALPLPVTVNNAVGSTLVGNVAGLVSNVVGLVGNGGGPVGNVPPPDGTRWVVTFNDNFAQDAAVNTSIWNGAVGGGNPFCHPDGSLCGYSSTPIVDCLGFAGNEGDECAQNFGGSGYGDTIRNGTGLVVQDHNSAPGDNNYFDNEWAGIQNYGKFSQEFGYFEWVAKLPTDNAGEGDGLHTDLWCTPNGRSVLGANVPTGVEADVNEKVGGTGNRDYTWFTIWDGVSAATNFSYGVADGSDLSAAYHTYGLYWRNDGSGAYGSMQLYVDGAPQGSPAPINNSLWGGGIYCFGGFMQESDGWGGGNSLDSTTSDNDPLYVQRFTVWKGE
jgi:hypothetical protein